MRATERDLVRLEAETSRLVEQMKALGAAKVILFGSVARGRIPLFSSSGKRTTFFQKSYE